MKRLYYRLIVKIHINETIDLDTIIERIEYYNAPDHYLFFDSYLGDSKFSFIFGYKEKKSINDEISEMEALFEGEIVSLTLLKASELDLIQLKKLRLAKRITSYMPSGYEDIIPRWCMNKREEIFDKVEALTGFSEFKKFMRNLESYLKNVHSLPGEKNYNIVLINNCDVDETEFINCIFDLYVNYGVLLDSVVVYGTLSDAAKNSRNTSCLYRINEEWECFRENESLYSNYSNELLKKLSNRNTIFITSMNKKEFSNAKNMDNFKNLFIHSVELNEPSEDEKLDILKVELNKYGFNLDEKAFKSSDVLKLPIQNLKGRLYELISKLLYKNNKKALVIKPEDFGEKIVVNEKSGIEELDELIGLDEVKNSVKEIVAFIKKRGKDAVPCLHMVFKGNPGTGKTTVARIIGKIFSESKVLNKSNLFVETDREGLIGRFVGHTAIKTSEKVKEAMGGILFIDEAYSLAQSDNYSSEAISTLVKRMEDYRKEFICIMAGYTKEMEELLNVNPGLRDRIQFYIDFPDYSCDELLQIFETYCKKDKYILSLKAKKMVLEMFSLIVKNKEKNFSNARLVRKIFERVKMKQAIRTDNNRIIEKDIIKTFEEMDIKKYIEPQNAMKKIGF